MFGYFNKDSDLDSSSIVVYFRQPLTMSLFATEHLKLLENSWLELHPDIFVKLIKTAALA